MEQARTKDDGRPPRSSAGRDRAEGRGGERGGAAGRAGSRGSAASRGRGVKRVGRRKVCRFTEEGVLYIDYKDYRLLREYTTERGKIVPRRISGTSAKHQRMLTRAIKRAREIALLPYVRK